MAKREIAKTRFCSVVFPTLFLILLMGENDLFPVRFDAIVHEHVRRGTLTSVHYSIFNREVHWISKYEHKLIVKARFQNNDFVRVTIIYDHLSINAGILN